MIVHFHDTRNTHTKLSRQSLLFTSLFPQPTYNTIMKGS